MKLLKDRIVILALVLAAFTSSHVMMPDTLGLRFELQALLIVLTSISILIYLKKGISSFVINEGFIIFLLVVTLMIGEIFFRARPEKVLGYIFALAMMFIVLSSQKNIVLKAVESLNSINIFFALLAFVGLAASIYLPSVFDAILIQYQYYNTNFPSGNGLFSLFGHADGYNNIYVQKILRISGHLRQKSLVSAYILLPLSIGLIFSKVRFRNICILAIFSIIALGATTIITLTFAIFVYSLRNYVKKAVFLVFPFFILSVLLVTSVYFFYDLYDLNNVKEIMQNYIEMSDDNNPLIDRFKSGLARLMLISFQAIEFSNVFPWPASEIILSSTFGSNLMTNALRGGVPALIISIFLYYKIFNYILIELINPINKNKLNKFGLALLYSIIFQSMVFSDYGFSTFYGFMMFAIILLLFKKNSNSRCLN